MKSEVKFADKNLGYAFQSLKDSKTEDKKLYDWLKRAIEDIEENAFCGIQIPKRLIPEIYIKNLTSTIFGNTIFQKAGGSSILLGKMEQK